MANTTGVFELVAGTALHAADVLPWVDTTDGTQGAQGSLKKITVTNFFATIPAPVIVTSAGATALTVGRQGVTHPAFQVDASAGSSVTGLVVQALAAGNGVNLNVTSSASNEILVIAGKGTSGAGRIVLQSDLQVGIGQGVAVTGESLGLANNGTFDMIVESWNSGGSFCGILVVTNHLGSNASVRTQTTYSVFGRGTATITYTQIATVTTGGGYTFTLATSPPASGTVRVTNTGGAASNLYVAFYGHTGS